MGSFGLGLPPCDYRFNRKRNRKLKIENYPPSSFEIKTMNLILAIRTETELGVD